MAQQTPACKWLVTELEQRRARGNDTHKKIAENLGIDEAQWWRIRTGKQPDIGDQLLRGLAKHYPDLYVMLIPVLQSEYDTKFPPVLPRGIDILQ